MAEDIVRLGVTTELEARIWRDALAQEAIPVFIRPASPLSVTGIGPPSIDMLVFVRAADERRARWIIGEGIVPPETLDFAAPGQDDLPPTGAHRIAGPNGPAGE